MERNVFWAAHYIFADYAWLTLDDRIYCVLRTIQPICYPMLAIVAVPVNLVTIVILSRGKCGLSKGVTRYLVSMASSDLLVVILDLILRQIPIAYPREFRLMRSFPACNVHAVLLYAATDCSVWFTVTFTFDRCVSICSAKLRSKYCTERTAAVVLGTVSVLSCCKNIFWYFLLRGWYYLLNNPWFCYGRKNVLYSPVWATIEFLHYLVTPVVPFALVLLLNALTIRHVLVASRARKRLRGSSSGEQSGRDPEMENRRKSLVLLLVISGNFIVLWALFTVYYVWARLRYLGPVSTFPPWTVRELGFMLQLLSCCTNTAIYVATQRKFREQLKEAVKSPRALLGKCARRLRNPRQCLD
ncbi:putative G-protein coupled receptor 139 [Rhinoraja longicauda]